MEEPHDLNSFIRLASDPAVARKSKPDSTGSPAWLERPSSIAKG